MVDGLAVPMHLPLLPFIMLVSISCRRRLFGCLADDALSRWLVGGCAIYDWCDLRYASHFTSLSPAKKTNAIFDRGGSLSTPSL